MNRRSEQQVMRPLDVAVLLKIVSDGAVDWKQQTMAKALHLSQSEVSKSIARSKYAGLLNGSGKSVRRFAFMDFLEKGIAYVFPQRPGEIVRGMPTSHSVAPLMDIINSNEKYVWPSATGTVRGQSIVPLYPQLPAAAIEDKDFYSLLALIDAIRVGQKREKRIAIAELRKRILDEKQND